MCGSQLGRADPVNRLPIAGLTDYLFLSIVFAIGIAIEKDTKIGRGKERGGEYASRIFLHIQIHRVY